MSVDKLILEYFWRKSSFPSYSKGNVSGKFRSTCGFISHYCFILHIYKEKCVSAWSNSSLPYIPRYYIICNPTLVYGC